MEVIAASDDSYSHDISINSTDLLIRVLIFCNAVLIQFNAQSPIALLSAQQASAYSLRLILGRNGAIDVLHDLVG